MVSSSDHANVISSHKVSDPALGGILFLQTAVDDNPPFLSMRFWQTSACRVPGQNERGRAS